MLECVCHSVSGKSLSFFLLLALEKKSVKCRQNVKHNVDDNQSSHFEGLAFGNCYISLNESSQGVVFENFAESPQGRSCSFATIAVFKDNQTQGVILFF